MSPWLYFILCFVLLFFGSRILVKGFTQLTLKFGISAFVFGWFILPWLVNAPELFLCQNAMGIHLHDLAVAVVIGSSIFDILFILGLSALFKPIQIHSRIVRWDIPWWSAACLLTFYFFLDSRLERHEGIALLGFLFSYIIFNVYLAFRQKRDALAKEFQMEFKQVNLDTVRYVCLILVGGAFVYGSTKAIIFFTPNLLYDFSLTEKIVGATLMSLGVSFPELIMILNIARKKEGDIAVGNIITSNLFKVLGILGVCALRAPINVSSIDIFDWLILFAVSIIILPIALTRYQITRAEGLFMLACYGGFIYYLLA